jgi:hypothetical protein
MGDDRDRGRYPRAPTPPSVKAAVQEFEDENTDIQRLHLYHEVSALRNDHQGMRRDIIDVNRKVDEANHKADGTRLVVDGLTEHVSRLRVETGQQTVSLGYLVETTKAREIAAAATGEGNAMRRSNWAIAFLSLAGVVLAAVIAAAVAIALAPKG